MRFCKVELAISKKNSIFAGRIRILIVNVKQINSWMLSSVRTAI